MKEWEEKKRLFFWGVFCGIARGKQNSRASDDGPLVQPLGPEGFRSQAGEPVVAIHGHTREAHLQLPRILRAGIVGVPNGVHATIRREQAREGEFQVACFIQHWSSFMCVTGLCKLKNTRIKIPTGKLVSQPAVSTIHYWHEPSWSWVNAKFRGRRWVKPRSQVMGCWLPRHSSENLP